MENKKRIVTDFDGTITDTRLEAVEYLTCHRDMTAKALRLSPASYDDFYHQAEVEVKTHSGDYGWEVGGFVVAPAMADPYVFSTTAAKVVARMLKISLPDEIWEHIFTEAYKKTSIAFKDDAKDYLNLLQEKTHLVVVTNSDSTKVLHKLSVLLGENHGIQVIGGAKKYVVNPQWTIVPESIQPEGFPRPVYLRRSIYGELLQSLGKIDAVVGDIYELDLALPEQLGIETMLSTSAQSISWEKQHYFHHPHGMSSDSLLEIATALLSGK